MIFDVVHSTCNCRDFVNAMAATEREKWIGVGPRGTIYSL